MDSNCVENENVKSVVGTVHGCGSWHGIEAFNV